ncbi:cellular retinaldehyde-binding/triple function domain protein [Aspergillus oryzae]|uniref:Cellular retinaldehyde-binding/triple function domain protein n=2 Tax=Aspergillus oryzae TaxID=5062 RepID=A0A1S9DIZ3_ASPOZ|nr:cellular retinaldehyde-binding/triple function domain protein [Aspergillus oryzae]
MGLSKEEIERFTTFNRLCTEHGLSERPKGLDTGDVQDGINDEVTLLRFFKASHLNPHRALQQLEEATRFREEQHVLHLYMTIHVDDFEDTRRFYPHWTGRRDKRGLPILMVDMAHYDQAAMAQWKKTRDMSCCTDPTVTSTAGPNMAQRATVFHDSLTRFVLPLCSAMDDRPNPLTPVSNAVYIVDASVVSVKQAWNLKDFAQEVSWILMTCYPETIERIFVCNVPSYFSTIWSIFKKWMDPVTAAKVVVLKQSDVYTTLERYIDKENIPTKFGGGFAFQNGMLPDLDHGIRQHLQWTTPSECIPSGPVKWMQADGGKRIAIATGSVDRNVPRNVEIAALY